MSKGRSSVLAIAVATVLLLGNGTDPALAQAERAGGESGDVTLRIQGDEGTRFSGACSVGGERREISGQAPESFEFDLKKGRSLSCEVVKKEDSNELAVVLDGENVHAEQRLAGEQGTSKITYDGNGSVSAMSSSSQTTSNDRSSSLSKAEEKALKNLDDRIGQRVDDLLERVMP